MTLYIGTKIVKLTPMTRQEYVTYRGWKLPADENAADEGYLVEYTDGGKPNDVRHNGYISWSPKEQADKAYKPHDGKTHSGLPVAGYRPQNSEAVSLVNKNKEDEERILRTMERLNEHGDVDGRWMAIAKTHFEQAYMAYNRAIFKPGRVELAEDGQEDLF